jgi:hypothetical protein
MYLTHSEIQQLDLLKKKRPSDRFLLMRQLIGGQIAALKAGLRYKHPDIDNEELEQCLKSTMKKIYSLKL